MDQKQFERLQTAVQWAVDEEAIATPTLTVNMDVWGFGEVARGRGVIKAKYDEESKHAIEVKAVCPTACCLAGNIVLAAGDEFIIDKHYYDGETVYADNCVDDKGIIHSIPVRALDLIGLNDDHGMFEGSQSASDIVAKAEMVAEDYGFSLDIK
jgi:hypothetical protein